MLCGVPCSSVHSAGVTQYRRCSPELTDSWPAVGVCYTHSAHLLRTVQNHIFNLGKGRSFQEEEWWPELWLAPDAEHDLFNSANFQQSINYSPKIKLPGFPAARRTSESEGREMTWKSAAYAHVQRYYMHMYAETLQNANRSWMPKFGWIYGYCICKYFALNEWISHMSCCWKDGLCQNWAVNEVKRCKYFRKWCHMTAENREKGLWVENLQTPECTAMHQTNKHFRWLATRCELGHGQF